MIANGNTLRTLPPLPLASASRGIAFSKSMSSFVDAARARKREPERDIGR
jgi:hypothetical protein